MTLDLDGVSWVLGSEEEEGGNTNLISLTIIPEQSPSQITACNQLLQFPMTVTAARRHGIYIVSREGIKIVKPVGEVGGGHKA
jgi:hypothetical protein